jgi:hypothetical protein
MALLRGLDARKYWLSHGGGDWWHIEHRTTHLLISQACKIYSDVRDRNYKFAFVRHPVGGGGHDRLERAGKSLSDRREVSSLRMPRIARAPRSRTERSRRSSGESVQETSRMSPRRSATADAPSVLAQRIPVPTPIAMRAAKSVGMLWQMKGRGSDAGLRPCSHPGRSRKPAKYASTKALKIAERSIMTSSCELPIEVRIVTPHLHR